jgi:hypothetical protein
LAIQVCPNGHENSGNAKFCGMCGASLEVLEPAVEDSAVVDSGTVESVGDDPDLEVETVAPEEFAVAKKPANVRRWLILAGAAVFGVLVIGGGAYFFTTTPAVEVVGMSESRAIAALEEQGLTATVRNEEFSNTVPKGSVTAQEPMAGTRVGSGSKVSLVLSRGPARTVPNVEGDQVSAATSAVESASLQVSRADEPSDTVPEGQVISQSPASGTDLEDGDTVSLVVSSGPPRTLFTYIGDVSATVTNVRSADCDLAVLLWRSVYSSAVVQNQDEKTVSTLDGRWEAAPGNGRYYPCYAIAKFPDTPTNEERYRVAYSPTNADKNRSPWFTREKLESEDWTVVD